MLNLPVCLIRSVPDIMCKDASLLTNANLKEMWILSCKIPAFPSQISKLLHILLLMYDGHLPAMHWDLLAVWLHNAAWSFAFYGVRRFQLLHLYYVLMLPLVRRCVRCASFLCVCNTSLCGGGGVWVMKPAEKGGSQHLLGHTSPERSFSQWSGALVLSSALFSSSVMWGGGPGGPCGGQISSLSFQPGSQHWHDPSLC